MNSFDLFGQTASHMFSLYEQWIKTKGLNYSTLAVLHTLVKENACTQKHICKQWGLPKQTISASCQKLHKDGLIAFSANGTDGREKQLHLTEQGKAVAEPLIDELNQIEQRAVQAFGEKRAERFIQEMSRFVATLEKEINTVI